MINFDLQQIFLLKSQEDNRVIKNMAETLSKKELDTWALRADHQKEVVHFIATRKAQANVVDSQTNHYRKCDRILNIIIMMV